MIRIPCPHCGPRNSSEFAYGGEVKPRPAAAGVSQAEWRQYLYVKSNPAGWTSEQWFHSSGCRKWIYAERHTVTNKVRATWLPGTPAPSGGGTA